KMNSTNTINHLEKLKINIMKTGWKRLILIWDNASYHVNQMVRFYQYIEELNDRVSEYLDKQFGRWC
ncbi:MAG: hypothetical protein WAM14_11970, partial [Candidatus Nitrosopolaris sp.]